MSTILQYLALSIGGATLLDRYAPAYSMGIALTSISLFFTVVLARLVWSGTVYPRFFSPFKNIPMAPDGEFFLGHTRTILREASGLPARGWIEATPNDGMIRYVNWFRERLLVTNPQVLKEMLMTKSYEFVKPAQVRHGLARILGRGVLFAEGDEHKVQRKNLLPAFAFRHVKDLYPIFWDRSGDLVEAVAEAAKDAAKNSGHRDPEKVAADDTEHAPGAIEVGGWVSRSTLDIIGVSGMDRDFNALRDPDNELSKQYRNVLNPSRTARYLGVLAFFLPRWFVDRIPVKDNQNIWNAADYVRKVCRDMIVKKRQALAENKSTRPDIISIALKSGMFNDDELVNQMMTFLIAGHETTASAMSWAILMLCRNPQVQTKLRNAIRQSIPSGLRSSITPSDIDDCHYLSAFCNEVLRLWPPVTMTLRVAAKDTSLNSQFIPKDTLVILSPMAINASTDMWGPDATEFRPERWLDETTGRANNSGGADSAYSFLTFLHGPRACIGQKFAEAEFACLVAAWVGRFNTTLEEGSPHASGFPEIKGGVTSRPKGGVYVHLKEIPGW